MYGEVPIDEIEERLTVFKREHCELCLALEKTVNNACVYRNAYFKIPWYQWVPDIQILIFVTAVTHSSQSKLKLYLSTKITYQKTQ